MPRGGSQDCQSTEVAQSETAHRRTALAADASNQQSGAYTRQPAFLALVCRVNPLKTSTAPAAMRPVPTGSQMRAERLPSG